MRYLNDHLAPASANALLRSKGCLLLGLLLGGTATGADTVSLFNGRDLSGWHVDVPAADDGKIVSPSFVVRDGLLVSLGSPGGHLITDAVYQDYRLVVEYRWAGEPGNCGVLAHASTPRRLYQMFPASIECQMHVGNAGDFWCIGEDISVENMEAQRGPKEKWGVDEGRARRIRNVTDDSESPVGEWNQMVVECRGRTIDVFVNGDHVNHGFDCTADRGQIAIQAEGAEAEFRRIELTKLPPPPSSPLPAATDVPELFAPGIVSSAANELATTFSPDGRTVYFNRVLDDNIQILRSNWNGGWGIAKPLEWSTGARDMDPFLSPQGDALYFSSDRDFTDHDATDARPVNFDLWVSPALRVSGAPDSWGPPTRLPSPPNSPGMEAFLSVATSGAVYFDRKSDVDGARRLFRSQPVDGEYGLPDEIDFGLQEDVSRGNPLVLPDESALIFVSRGLGGPGGADLCISYREPDGRFSTPQVFPAPINSRFEEYAPGLSADGRTLFFTSTRAGGVTEEEGAPLPTGDIYFVRMPTRDR